MKNSHIEWTHHTFNPWIGCTKVSPGCLHCYAETRDKRFAGGVHWGKGAPRQRTSVHNWNEPVRWDREAEKTGIRKRVFCASLADWLDDEVPIEWLADLLRLIRRTPNLDWLLLTKRPENWKARLHEVVESEPMSNPDDCYPDSPRTLFDWIIDWYNNDAPANVWIGTTVEDQERANLRIPKLIQIPARIRFLSCEPLLSEVDLGLNRQCPGEEMLREVDLGLNRQCPGEEMLRWVHPLRHEIHWVICGGESGPDARPMLPHWAVLLRNQCADADVPFLFKQWGERDSMGRCVGKLRAGRLLAGVEHNGYPV